MPPDGLAAATRPEEELLFCCARTQLGPAHAQRIGVLLQGKVDWDYLLWISHRHKLTQLLYRHLRTVGPAAVPAPILQQLQLYVRAVARRNVRLTAELLQLLGHFAAQGIDMVPFKGPILAFTAYGDLLLRQSSDLDLLVRRPDVGRAEATLVSRGYQPEYPFTPAQLQAFIGVHYERVFFHGHSEIMVDLHWQITPGYVAGMIDYQHVKPRLQSVLLGGTTVPVLSPEDLLLILCIHAAKHHWTRLSWLCDIAELLHTHGGAAAAGRPALDWPWIEQQSRELACQRMLHLGLYLTEELLGAELPEDVGQRVQANPHVKPLACRVVQGLFPRPDGGRGNGQDRLFMVQVRDRLWDRVRFAIQRAVTPTPPDVASLALPRGWAGLYYLLRPFRLLARYVREQLSPLGMLADFKRTSWDIAERMLALAEVGSQDVVYDLGCGDGRIVIAAAKLRGARAIGIDSDAQRIAEANRNAAQAGVQELVTFLHEDVEAVDLSAATVVTLYLSATGNLLLLPILQRRLRPGARVVSHAADLGDWEPARMEIVPDDNGGCTTIYLWRVEQ